MFNVLMFQRLHVRSREKTPWIQTESLEDFLHPDDLSKTIEGYPAPVRAIFTACAQ